MIPLEVIPEPSEKGDGVERTLLERERRNAVRRALDDLSEEQREALVLARYHGMPYAEVARVLGISVGAVKTRIFRAVETLKARFQAGDLAVPRTPSSEGEQSWNAAN